jgi:CheY-like chemotaxis protein
MTAHAGPPRAGAVARHDGRKRVLVVDDSFIMRKVMAEIVDSDPDLEVVDTAENGRVALQKVRQFQPDAVLLDIAMPEMSGLETLRRLGLRSPCKVIVLSSLVAGADSAERIEALRLGAAAAIGKPSTFPTPLPPDRQYRRIRRRAPLPISCSPRSRPPCCCSIMPGGSFAPTPRPIASCVIAISRLVAPRSAASAMTSTRPLGTRSGM